MLFHAGFGGLHRHARGVSVAFTGEAVRPHIRGTGNPADDACRLQDRQPVEDETPRDQISHHGHSNRWMWVAQSDNPRLADQCRSWSLRTLPIAFRGSALTNLTERGRLCTDRPRATKSINSASVTPSATTNAAMR